MQCRLRRTLLLRWGCEVVTLTLTLTSTLTLTLTLTLPLIR